MPKQIRDLTSAEVAARLGVTTRTVQRLYARGYFPNARKFGAHTSAPLAIPEPDLIAYEKTLAAKPSRAERLVRTTRLIRAGRGCTCLGSSRGQHFKNRIVRSGEEWI